MIGHDKIIIAKVPFAHCENCPEFELYSYTVTSAGEDYLTLYECSNFERCVKIFDAAREYAEKEEIV